MEIPTLLKTATRAVELHQVLQFEYRGVDRIAEPHLIGVSGDGICVLTWQVDPDVSAKGECWRTFRLAEMSRVISLSRVFVVRSSFDPRSGSLQFSEVFATAQ